MILILILVTKELFHHPFGIVFLLLLYRRNTIFTLMGKYSLLYYKIVFRNSAWKLLTINYMISLVEMSSWSSKRYGE